MDMLSFACVVVVVFVDWRSCISPGKLLLAVSQLRKLSNTYFVFCWMQLPVPLFGLKHISTLYGVPAGSILPTWKLNATLVGLPGPLCGNGWSMVPVYFVPRT